MSYTIQEVSEITGLSAHTLRYYDREGVMPFLRRDKQGNRIFEKRDLQWLQVVRCMKIAGFTLADMREYANMVKQGDESLPARLALFDQRRGEVLRKMEELQAALDAINYKCWYYQTAVEAGTEQVHLTNGNYDQALCYSQFKTWEKQEPGKPSQQFEIFGKPWLVPSEKEQK